MATAEYQREWRARNGARTGQPGRPITAECGTASAYRRHVRKQEEPCQPCRDAWAQYHRDMRIIRRNRKPS